MELLMMAQEEENDPQLIADTFESLEGEIEEKLEQCAYVLKELEGEADKVKKECDRLQARKKSIERNVDRLKEAVKEMMILTGNRQVKAGLFTYTVAKNPVSVVLETEDTDLFPEQFLKHQAPTIDKVALKQALKNGETFEGLAHLEQTEGLRLK